MPAFHEPGDDLSGTDAVQAQSVHNVRNMDRQLKVASTDFYRESGLS